MLAIVHPKRLLPALLLLLLLSCSRAASPTPTQTPVPTPLDRSQITPTPISLTRYDNGTSFAVQYPTHWTNQLLRQGIMLFASPEDIDLTGETTAASMVVYRRPPADALDLHSSFDSFVTRGPLATGYQLVGSVSPTTIDSRSGLYATVRRDANDDFPAVRSEIVATLADNKATYIVVTTAPEAEYESWAITFQLMRDSLGLYE